MMMTAMAKEWSNGDAKEKEREVANNETSSVRIFSHRFSPNDIPASAHDTHSVTHRITSGRNETTANSSSSSSTKSNKLNKYYAATSQIFCVMCFTRFEYCVAIYSFFASFFYVIKYICRFAVWKCYARSVSFTRARSHILPLTFDVDDCKCDGIEINSKKIEYCTHIYFYRVSLGICLLARVYVFLCVSYRVTITDCGRSSVSCLLLRQLG